MSKTLPTIAFVDSEIATLKKLQQLLQNEPWDCHYITSPTEATALFAQQPIDLIVSELTLSNTDGMALLKTVKHDYPATVRLLLTSAEEKNQITQALASGDAQQIIPKPWIDQELKEIIHSALRQSALHKKQNPQLQLLLNRAPLLPPLPQSYHEVRSCIGADETDFKKMAEIISRDMAISTTMLRWANSALFGQRFHVDTIQKAIVVLGTNIVESLVLSEAINRALTKKLPDIPGFDPKKLQQHSFATAALARLLIKSLYSSNLDLQDRAFICGLLHDLGKLAAASYFPAEFGTAIRLASERNRSQLEAEIEAIGIAHSELGGFLAEWWTLPPPVVNAILWHHDPLSSPVEPEVLAAVHVANQLSYQFGFGINQHPSSAKSCQESWDRFYLSDEGIEILQVETEKLLQVIQQS